MFPMEILFNKGGINIKKFNEIMKIKLYEPFCWFSFSFAIASVSVSRTTCAHSEINLCKRSENVMKLMEMLKMGTLATGFLCQSRLDLMTA